MTPVASDRVFLEQALALAAGGEGTTSPNPRVGAIVVRAGRVVGFGHHEAAGRPHAEANAVRMAGRRARGGTLFVNLEPCAHHGRTPPCADLLVAAGIRRVVASIQDPNPVVNGRGFARLAEAGIRVEIGLLETLARRLNAPFLHWHATGRPLVTLKAAASLDGRIAARGGAPRWISGSTSLRLAHRLRFANDAVLVGAGTIRADDPRLTVRLRGVRAERLRVVLAPELNVDPDAKVFRRRAGAWPRPRIYAASDAPRARERRFAGRADVVRVPAPRGRLDLGAVLRDLGRQGVQSLLVEGGGRTWAGFLAAGLADRIALFSAGLLLGSDGTAALVENTVAGAIREGTRLRRLRVVPAGEDALWIGEVIRGGAS